jgi:hypothetical protein
MAQSPGRMACLTSSNVSILKGGVSRWSKLRRLRLSMGLIPPRFLGHQENIAYEAWRRERKGDLLDGPLQEKSCHLFVYHGVEPPLGWGQKAGPWERQRGRGCALRVKTLHHLKREGGASNSSFQKRRKRRNLPATSKDWRGEGRWKGTAYFFWPPLPLG